MEVQGNELTQHETALYDRQIRVWGADAQLRLSKSHILVYGISGTVAELCKNIVLAGIGSLILMDDRPVTEKVLHANFLLSPCDNVNHTNTIADICCNSLKGFNPMVRVSVEKGDLMSFGLEFIDKFDVVVASNCSLAVKKSINKKCRKLDKHVAFFYVDCRDSCGEIFVDLQEHVCEQKKEDMSVTCKIHYPSFQEAISIPWSILPRKISDLYFAMRVIERLEEDSEGCHPGETSRFHLPAVLKLKADLCAEQGVDESRIPNALLERLVVGAREFPPVCAVMGGILGQEIIKAISHRGTPLKNFFYFDTLNGKGIIEEISNPA